MLEFKLNYIYRKQYFSMLLHFISYSKKSFNLIYRLEVKYLYDVSQKISIIYIKIANWFLKGCCYRIQAEQARNLT